MEYQKYQEQYNDKDIEGFFDNCPEIIDRIQEKINYNGINIKLGRSTKNNLGTVQNIIISYNNKEISSEDGVVGLGEMNIVINDNEIIVGMIRLPKNYQGLGLAKHIYQAVADKIGLPIVNSKTRGYDQSESGGYIRKNRQKFQPNKINTKEIKQIYTDYINTFFSNHVLVYRGDTPDLESFHYSEQIRKKGSLIMNYLKFGSGIYLTNNKGIANNFAKQNNGKLYYCLINKDNIISFNNKEEYDNHIKQYYTIERVTTLNRDNYIKYLQSQNKILHIKNNGEGKEEFITNMDNLHILGSEKDIEGFRNYISNNKNTKDDLFNNLNNF